MENGKTNEIAAVEIAVTGGLKPRTGVGNKYKVELGPRGLIFRGDPDFETWRKMMQAVTVAKESYLFAQADLITYGREKFTEEQVDEVLEQLELPEQDVMAAFAIGQLELELRTPELSAEHHLVLARLEDAGEQRKWRDLALKDDLTALELKKSIEAGKVIRQSVVSRQSGRGSSVITVQGLSLWFEKWQGQVGGDEVFSWEPERKKEVLETLKPMRDFIERLEESLKEEE